MQQNSKAEQALLQKLATSETLDHAEGVVKNLAKKFGYRWHPVGNNEANYGSINIGSDPGVALIERVTNAIDAVIEREALRNSKKRRPNSLPTSPREAADLWFRIPGGRVASLGDPAKRQPIADNILIRLIEGRSRRRPTILIRDRGVGLTPDLIPKTILSLGGSNKIDKPYLSGAYGQGGQQFSPSLPTGRYS